MAYPLEVNLYSGSILSIREYCCPGEDASGDEEEFASHHEIVFPRSGVYVKRDARGEVVADPNHVLFFHKHQPYHITHPVAGEDVSTVFRVTTDVLLDVVNRTTNTRIENPDKPFEFNAIRVEPVIKAEHITLLNAIEHAREKDALELEERVLAFLEAVLRIKPYAAAWDDACCKSAASKREHDELVAQTKVAIGKYFRDKLSLGFIGRTVYHSPFSLSRIFKRHTGITIHQYLIRTRLLHGLEILADCDQDKIGNIGVDLGFASHSHFTTSFNQVFRMTPSRFQEKINRNMLLQMEKYLVSN